MKFAVLYKRRGKLILGAQGRTSAGILIGVEQPVVADAGISAAELGVAIRETLRRSKSPIPHPQPNEWPSITATFLQGAEVKTWGSFVRGALLTAIEADSATIRFQPYENRGARDAFQPLGLSPIEIGSSASDEEVGVAALNALKAAESREPRPS